MPRPRAIAYYALPDTTGTAYWRRMSDATLRAWPPGTWNGPRGLGADAYMAVVHQVLDADPDLARARYAILQHRCSTCGRRLTDARSRDAAIGPTCRRRTDPDELTRLADRVTFVRAQLHHETPAAAA